MLRLTGKSFRSIFSKSASPKASMEVFTKDLEQKLTANFEQRTQDGVEDIADSIRQMAQIIDLKIKSSTALQKPRQDVFGDISERRKMVMGDLKKNFSEFLQRTENFAGKEIMPRASSVSPNLAAGSGMAIIGIVLTAMTSIPALDITGGIISAVGFLFAGGTILLKRGKIIQGFNEEIKKGRKQLEEVLTDKLEGYVAHIRQKIDSNFSEFDEILNEQATYLSINQEKYQTIKDHLEEVRKSIS